MIISKLQTQLKRANLSTYFKNRCTSQQFSTIASHFKNQITPELKEALSQEREEIECDVLVVGGGPAGLATAIKLKQLEQKYDKPINVCLIEKGSEIGSHILSGNCFQSDSFSELFPNWEQMDKELRPPIHQKVTDDKFKILFKNKALSVPEFLLPKSINNRGNYIISLGELCNWMGEQATDLGVDMYTGFAADSLLMNEDSSKQGIIGVKTGDFGIGKNLYPKENFQLGINIRAKQTVLAEGCRGSLSEKAKKMFYMQGASDNQSYGIGLKEVWEVPEELLTPGLVEHTVGWPLSSDVYGGTFMYHMGPNLIHLGMVIGLDYRNPYLNPYEEFQRWKTHSEIRKYLEKGTCIKYGARALNEGGFYAVPESLAFPGGMLVGCSAGFLDVAKIKGAHNAISTGMIAAETLYKNIVFDDLDQCATLQEYTDMVQRSEVMKELKESRNFKGGFKKGLYGGLAHGYVSSTITKGKEPWAFRNKQKLDGNITEPARQHSPIEYPKPDGTISFDLLENLQRSGTNHDDDQPSHLRIKEGKEFQAMRSLNELSGPEARFCPAKVYEFVDDDKGAKRLQINAQNCLHCKTCSIKMLDEYIDWNVPQGGEGPEYTQM